MTLTEKSALRFTYSTDQWMKIKGETLTSLDGVFTLGGLSGKHDTVSSVKDSVGDIRDLGSGRSGVVLNCQGKIIARLDQGTYGHGLFLSA